MPYAAAFSTADRPAPGGRAGGRDAHLAFQLRPCAWNDETWIEFVSDLNELEQHSVVLVWDRLPSHRSRRMLNWIASQRQWLSVEPLPGYALDLIPTETGVGQSHVPRACQTVQK